MIELRTRPQTPREALEIAVLDGIALLEREYGPEWFHEIDLYDLDLSSATYCIVGQLQGKRRSLDDWGYADEWRDYEAYVEGVQVLGIDGEVPVPGRAERTNAAAAYGFITGALPYDGLDEEGRQRVAWTSYDDLAATWKATIRALLDGRDVRQAAEDGWVEV